MENMTYGYIRIDVRATRDNIDNNEPVLFREFDDILEKLEEHFKNHPSDVFEFKILDDN